MCKTCVDASLDAAFTNGFSPEPKRVEMEEGFSVDTISLLDLEYDDDRQG